MLWLGFLSAFYEHQPYIPALHSWSGATADFAAKNDTWFGLLHADGVRWATRTMASTLLLPRPQMVHANLPTDVAWHVRRADGAVCHVTARAGVLAVDVACGEQRERLEGPWKQHVSEGLKVYMRASILNVRGGGWEMNATRKRTYTQVAGQAPWRYDLTARPLAASAACRGLLAETWASQAERDGAHDDYGERVDGSRYEIVTPRAQGEQLLSSSAAQYQLGSNLTAAWPALSTPDVQVSVETAPKAVGWF